MKEPADLEAITNPAAIETNYAGRLFRSRLEARWAVFYDAIRIPWVYEPEGFQFANGVLYLPDFYLPSVDAYMEIKPVRPSQREFDKCGWLAAHTQKSVFLFWGMVGHQIEDGYPSGQVLEDSANAFSPDKESSYWWSDESYAWCRCTKCGRYGIEYEGRSARICKHDLNDRLHNYQCRSLTTAYDRANQARF